MRLIGIANLGLALGTCFVLSACGESGNSPPPAAPNGEAAQTSSTGAPSSTTEDDVQSDGVRDRHRHAHGGVMTFVAMSIDTLGLPADKRAQAEKIQSDLQAKLAPARDAEQTVLSTIADGVAAGNVDTAKVDSAIAQLGTAAGNVQASANADALNQLHTLLDANQRRALVDKVMAHWSVYKHVNSDEEASSHEHGSRLAKLATELSLTPDQVDKISASLKSDKSHFEPKGMESHVQAFGTAFIGDSFDATRFVLPGGNDPNSGAATGGATKTAHFYEAVTPVLTPEQRTKLADSLRRYSVSSQTASGK